VALATLTITDRLAIRIYANVDTRVVTLHTENSHLCQVVTTFSKGLNSLNNLTRQVQFLGTGTSGTDFNISSATATHTFNLPTASATNRGALSSADWSTFNSKQPAGNYVTLDTTQTITGTKTFSVPTYFTSGLVTNNSAFINTELFLKNTATMMYATDYTTIIGTLTGVKYGLGPNSVNSEFIFQTGASYSYTFPATSGTLALTSNLSAYLPLTGGTLSGQLSILRGSGTGLDVASDLVIFRASTGFGSPRQITLAAGNGATTYLEAKGYGGNYITDFGIRTYNSSGTAFEVFFATSAGDVGIGNTAPAAKLDVNGTGRFIGAITIGTNFAQLLPITALNSQFLTGCFFDGSNVIATAASGSRTIYNSGGIDFRNFTGATIGSSVTDTSRMTITSGGNVGIGTTSPTYKLEINAGSVDYNTVRLYSSESSQLLIESTSSSRQATVDYKSASKAYSTGLNTDGSWFIYDNTRGAFALRINTSGVTTIPNLAGSGSRAVLADASGVLSAPISDISVKENITSIGYGLNEILKMNPVWFDFIDEYKNYGQGRQNGNIAQEMESIIPEAVFVTPSTGKMGINYDQLHAVYIKAIQELKIEIDHLKNK
jgi:hypothetical protein